MATFQAKIGRKRMSKGEIKITVPFRSYPTCDRKFQKKRAKKFEKFKNIDVASLKAKIGTKTPRKREIKNYRVISFRFYRMRNIKLHKNCKKTQKIKKCHLATFQAKIGQKTTRKFENKNYGFIMFLPDA